MAKLFKIKELEWKKLSPKIERADFVLGHYIVYDYTHKSGIDGTLQVSAGWSVSNGTYKVKTVSNLEEAKAACQDDCEQQLEDCLTLVEGVVVPENSLDVLLDTAEGMIDIMRLRAPKQSDRESRKFLSSAQKIKTTIEIICAAQEDGCDNGRGEERRKDNE